MRKGRAYTWEDSGVCMDLQWVLSQLDIPIATYDISSALGFHNDD